MPAARMLDDFVHPSGKIMQGSMDVITGGMPQARVLDQVVAACPCTGKIILGSFKVFVNKKPAARMLDKTLSAGIHPPAPGIIIKGCFTVLMG